MPPNADRGALIQVGWWLPDEMRPERMSDRTWEEERIMTLWTLEDNGGFAPQWEGKAVPVYVSPNDSFEAP